MAARARACVDTHAGEKTDPDFLLKVFLEEKKKHSKNGGEENLSADAGWAGTRPWRPWRSSKSLKCPSSRQSR